MLTEICNQSHVQHLLQQAVKNNALASAYLFVGAFGVGKSLTARWFAEYINTNSCNEKINIENKQLFANRDHPDFIIVKAEGKFIKIKQIKQLIEQLQSKPSHALTRVIFIKEADKMNIESANAFLKTLEEPPQNTLIILSCENTNSLPETILSRCQVIRFQLLSEQSLQLIYDKINPLEEEHQSIIYYSNGSIRKDLLYHKDFFLELQKQLAMLFIRIDELNTIDILELIEKLSKKDEKNYMIEFMLNWFLDLQFFKLNLPNMIRNKLYLKEFSNIQKNIDHDQIAQIIDVIFECESSIKLFATKQLALEGMFLQIKKIIDYGA